MNKRIALMTIAACMALSSCSGKSSDSGNRSPAADMAVTEEHPTEMAANLLNNSYKALDVDIPDGMDNINNIWGIGNGEFLLWGADWNSGGTPEEKLYILSSDLKSYRPFEPEFPEEYTGADEKYSSYLCCDEGKIYAVCFTSDHGGVKIPDEYDESFDYEAYENSGKQSMLICAFDTDGKLLSKVSPEGIFSYQNDYGGTNVNGLVPENSGCILLVNNKNLLRLSSDGKLEELMEYEGPENGYIDHTDLLKDSSGGLCLYVREQDFSEEKCIIRILPIDSQTGKAGEALYSSANNGYFDGGRITSGSGDDLLYLPDYEGLYGIRADGSAELLVNWADADITSGTALPVGEDEYIVLIRNLNGNDTSLVHLVHRDLSEVSDTKVITMAAMDSYADSSRINDFNRSQNDYRIKWVDYSQYNEPDDFFGTGALEQLKLDVISGKAPDIIISADHKEIMELSKKGAFVDIYPLMEGDTEVNKDTLMPNILRFGEGDDGGLYSLCSSFSVQTVGTKKKFGANESWTIKEMLDFYDNAPASADLIYKYGTKEEVFKNYFDWTSALIDSKSGKTDLNCEDFIRFLEFCNRFPEKEEEYEKYSDEWNSMMEEKWYKWPSDRDITEEVYLSSDHSYSFTRYCEAGEDITLAGYPSADGSGGFISVNECIAISSTCPEKEGAWQFIRSFLTKKAQNDIVDYGFSVRRDVFEKQVEKMKNFTDETGSPVDHYESKGTSYYPLTDEEAEWLSGYIMNCYKGKGEFDKDVYDICFEEAQGFFAGECSAEQAAEMIQNRVSIVVSEKS